MLGASEREDGEGEGAGRGSDGRSGVDSEVIFAVGCRRGELETCEAGCGEDYMKYGRKC